MLRRSSSVVLCAWVMVGCVAEGVETTSSDSEESLAEEALDLSAEARSPVGEALDLPSGFAIQLRNKQVARCLGVEPGSTSGGVGMFLCDGSIHQSWLFTRDRSGHGELKNVGSGRCIAAAANAVVQAACDGSAGQKWGIEAFDGEVAAVRDPRGHTLEGVGEDLVRAASFKGAQLFGGSSQEWMVSEALATNWPCTPDFDRYDAVVKRSDNLWTAKNKASGVQYTGSSYEEAVTAALNSLTKGRTRKESVMVWDSGEVAEGRSITVPGHTVLNVCGAVRIAKANAQARSFRASGPVDAVVSDPGGIYRTSGDDIDLPNYTFRSGCPTAPNHAALSIYRSNNVHVGTANIIMSGCAGGQGIGIRVDWRESDLSAPRHHHVQLDNVYAEATGSHAVETVGYDYLTIGTVNAKNVGEAGLLLQRGRRHSVSYVRGDNVGRSYGGYAALRFANDEGAPESGRAWYHNVTVNTVHANGNARGIFCVSNSGGFRINNLTVVRSDSSGQPILLQDCHYVALAMVSGTLRGGGEVRVAGASTDLAIRNLDAGAGTTFRVSPCSAPTISSWINVRAGGSGVSNPCPL